ncbi:MAG: methyltransferase domain-containing protein [Candidatus Dependentiae bacterium]|jgi:phosphoethanolamine N-methyltransferase
MFISEQAVFILGIVFGIASALGIIAFFLARRDHKSKRDFLIESYSADYCEELGFAYGDGFMSEGGTAAVDKLVEGIDLAGKTVLDFGSGMGGMALHLARAHRAKVIGIEINERMVAEAHARIPFNQKSLIQFMISNQDGSLPLADNSVDVVLSKGVIVHLTLAEREQAYAEFFRVLKPGGALVVNDLLSRISGVWSAQIERLIETESLPLYAQTVDEYARLIESNGFEKPYFIDETAEYADCNRALREHLEDSGVQKKFIDRFGEESWREHRQGYGDIHDSFARREAIIGTFRSHKPF